MTTTKKQENEQGFTHVLMMGLVIVILIIITLVGLSVVKKNKPATVNSSTTASSNSTKSSSAAYAACLTTYKDANLCHFSSSSTSLNKASYTATLTVTGSPNGDSSMVLQNDGKGNTSLVTTTGSQSFSSISLDGNTYVRTTAEGTWTQYSTSSTATPTTTTDPTSGMNIGVGDSGIYFKYIATEACGSLTCYKYQVTDSATPDTTQYVWFDKSKYQLQEWQATTPATGTTDMKISYKSVTISKPSPAQVFSAG